jgi:putative intracellular protease/amidase
LLQGHYRGSVDAIQTCGGLVEPALLNDLRPACHSGSETIMLTRRELVGAMLASTVVRGDSRSLTTARDEQSGATAGSSKDIALVLFEEVTLLDLAGPLQVLKGLARPFSPVVVGEDLRPMSTDTGLALSPQRRFEDVPDPFLVFVPGGAGSVAAMANPAVQEYLRRSARSAAVIASVCTGALVLAAAGLLQGRRATTHWAYARELELLGAKYVRERWVEDGPVITGAGVSAGIDLAFVLVAKLAGREEAVRIQLGIEYDPQPPHGGIDWTRVGDVQRERQRQGGTGRRLNDARRLLASRPDLLKQLMGSRK